MKKEALLLINKEMNNELNSFIQIHDFSTYTPNVGVFGENSTGKSTFLNAILGNKDEFKMGFGETTDKITVLYKNKRPIFKSEENIIKIKRDYKHLEYMNICDIPGFGQKFSHNQLSKIIKEIDIVFWFFDASKGVKKEDEKFLKNLKGLNTKVIVIFNKVDSISESNEMENLLQDINNEIFKIKTFFKKENLRENLVAIFPFSATKSLINKLKGNNGAFKIINKIIENVLLYTVFIESYRGYSKKVVENIERNNQFHIDNFTISNIVRTTSNRLEKALKENISLGSSLNPFSSKNEEAKPIVNKYIRVLTSEINSYIERFVHNIELNINENLNMISSFQSFGKFNSIDFKSKILPSLDINIDLNSMAWDSFFGDSFSEEVASNFTKKILRKTAYQIPDILEEYESYIWNFQQNLGKNTKDFANKLDIKLSKTTSIIQEPILFFLLKAILGVLNIDDEKYLQRMLRDIIKTTQPNTH